MMTYYSHKEKELHEHIKGVMNKASNRTPSKIVEVAALFHDIGKINPHFQNKLIRGQNSGYSSHSYLSVAALCSFVTKNIHFVENRFGTGFERQCYEVSLLIAKHHGNLPDLNNGIFRIKELKLLQDFLLENQELPISEYLTQHFSQFENHTPFSLHDKGILRSLKILNTAYSSIRKGIDKHLEFFLDIQYNFSCLIESDKRDASNNQEYKSLRAKDANLHFSKALTNCINSFASTTPINKVRTEIRNEALKNLQVKLGSDNTRVFSLTAPTGSGKTMMLLSLASEIQGHNPEHKIIYALPFLSIIDQVTQICTKIIGEGEDSVLSIDSRSENYEVKELIEYSDIDGISYPEKVEQLSKLVFSSLTFDHYFIVTTFVQLFETLVSNENKTLLKLPNFAKSIILIDEIQALPPRLYTFFIALLDELCKRIDSYVIVSSATMPYLAVDEDDNARKLFYRYPKSEELEKRELLEVPKYFANPVFNRYTINRINDNNFTLDKLASHILSSEQSCLVILNTIQDTKDLFSHMLNEKNISGDMMMLLNTHFHLLDRKDKIQKSQKILQEGKKVILISTQLIEAGVDIDFPVVYRDMCPLPNIIQSAGRCNRNGMINKGKVFFFDLLNKHGKRSCELIYRDKASKEFLEFSRNAFLGVLNEEQLFNIQSKFFKEEIADKLSVGKHFQTGLNDSSESLDLVSCIANAQFETLGQFRLIDKKVFGEEYRYYIPECNDSEFEKLDELSSQLIKCNDKSKSRLLKLKVESQIKSMSERIVSINLNSNNKSFRPPSSEAIFGIRKLIKHDDFYSSVNGLILDPQTDFIL